MTDRTPRMLKVVALVSAHNEGDLIAAVVGDLVTQGIHVHLLDHGSTDDTVAEARRHEASGLLTLEALPSRERFSWKQVLRRKLALARELDADWFIHHDADEFRESPWAGVSLRDGLARVDALGFNAVDFELLQFRPTTDDFTRGDPRQQLVFFERGEPFDRLQIKAWKNTGADVDLLTSGGHEASFEGRRVFPVRFLLRHYPVRSQAHGERKVFGERLGRFDAEERAVGWHRQYDGLQPGARFLRDADELTRFHPEAVRLELVVRHRELEQLEADLRAAREEARVATAHLARAHEDERLRVEVLERAAQAHLARAIDDRDALQALLATAQANLQRALEELAAERQRVEVSERASQANLQRALEELAGERQRVEVSERASQANLQRAHDELAGERQARAAAEREHEASVRRAEAMVTEAALRGRDLEALHQELSRVHREWEATRAALRATEARVLELLQSRTWRWAAPGRVAFELLARSQKKLR